ncbi:hypothetical protein CHUAL_007548 [Chamberlinius hualienensis]
MKMLRTANKIGQVRELKPTMLRKKRAKVIQKKWTENENLKILEYLIETKAKGLAIEKPSARLYYENLIAKTGIVNRNYDLVRNKVRNFHVRYKEALKWKEEVGNAIALTEGEEKFQLALANRYPYFQYCKDVWGDIYLEPSYKTDVPEIETESVENLECILEDGTEMNQDQFNPVILGQPECFVPFDTSNSHISSDSETPASPGGISRHGNEGYKVHLLPLRSFAKKREENIKEMFHILQKQLEFDQQLNASEAIRFERSLAERRADRDLKRELKTKELDIKQEEIRNKAEIRKLELEVERLKWETQLEMIKKNVQPFVPVHH